MDEYLETNRQRWNEITPIHVASEFYDVAGFKNGRSQMLYPVEFEEVGDVSGKSLLHLQCHFGLDTLTWARHGAEVTGVDFSDKAIETARSLSAELDIPAEFICADIYDLPDRLDKKFDIVYTSSGVITWLPDLEKWASVIAQFLKPAGFFYILDGHPLQHIFDDSADATEFKVRYAYSLGNEPEHFLPEGDYADSEAVITHDSYEWFHGLGEITTSLIDAGLRIEFLHEYPYINYQPLPFMQQDESGLWRVEGDKVPLIFSLKATKPSE